MKKSSNTLKTCLVVASAAIFSLVFASLISSCSSEDIPAPAPKTAELQLILGGTNYSRATGGSLPAIAAENTINNIAVGVFNTDGTVNTIAEPTLSGATTSTILCAPGTVDILVVANAPAGTFTGVQTKDEFWAKTVNLSQMNNSGVQASTNLPMSGETLNVALQDGYTTTPTVKVSRLVAKIYVNSIKTDFAQNGQEFILEKVFLYNALETSKVAPGNTTKTMPTTPSWLHGGTLVSNTWTPGTNYLLNTLSPAVNVTVTGELTTPFWFYGFANNNTSNPTKLVLAGKYKANTASPYEDIYYPIVVNKAQEGTTITNGDGMSTINRNTNYRITATIKTKGVSDPKEDLKPSMLAIDVEIEDWILEVLQEVVIE